MLLSIFLGVVLLFAGRTLLRLEANVRKARALGVPVVRTPFDLDSALWAVLQPLLWTFLSFLPISWSSYPDMIRFSHRNWNFMEKSGPIERFGSVWALVSPGGVHLQVADAAAIEDMFSRWREFVRPVHKYKILSIFGPSVFNAPIEEWSRHRRAVAAPFDESIMKFAWFETIPQAQSMLSYWSRQSVAGIPDVQRDLRTLTLNVLASTAFKEHYDFIGSVDLQEKDLSTAASFRDALLIVHKYIILLMVVPYRHLISPLMPKNLFRIGYAAQSLKEIMTKSVEQERTALKSGGSGSSGLMTSLVRAIDHNSNKGALSVEETLGNIFMINFAGLDTTANALAFTFMRLASQPKVQEWVHEEIRTVTNGRPVQEWEYELFPRLKRCSAVFLETLRLYAPIPGLPKMTASGVHTLKIGERVIAIPPKTDVFPMLVGMQTDARYWSDPYEWRPSRWILNADTPNRLDGEELFVPQKGSFFPWGEGPQGCLGKKVSQIEGVVVLATLLATHRVCAKSDPGETKEEIRARVEKCCERTRFTVALQVEDPKRVVLQCVEMQ